MKALSIQQPWAWLIVNADKYPDPKRVENRNWSTRFRGEVLIHAGKKFDLSGYLSVIRERPDLKDIIGAGQLLERGGIVGQVTIVDCVTRSESPWFVGEHGFVMERPISLPFTAVRGMLGFFEVDLEVIKLHQSPALVKWPPFSQLLSPPSNMERSGPDVAVVTSLPAPHTNEWGAGNSEN
jgi:hypothetical protein